MNKRTLSLAALTLLDVPPPEQVRIAARTGFTHVGLRLLPATPTDPDYDMLGDTPAVRATLAALMETGIRVSDVEIVRLTPRVYPRRSAAAFYGDRRASWRRTGVSRRQ